MDSVPLYQIRGFTLLGFRDMAQFLDYLYLGKNLKTGTLVAINAEKVADRRKPAGDPPADRRSGI